MIEAEFSPAWMLIAEMVVDEKGFVDQDAARFESAKQCRKEGPVEVQESEDDIVMGGRDVRGAGGIFKFHGAGRDGCQTLLRGSGRQIRQRLLVAIDRVDRESL